MAHLVTEVRDDLNIKQDDFLASKRFVLERKPEIHYFYELEAAIVLDVILDESHPEVKNIESHKKEPNYEWVGMIKFRFVNSQKMDDKSVLSWAKPMESTGISEYPLMNEVVIIGKYLGSYYYTRKINLNGAINSDASFELEMMSTGKENTDEYTKKRYPGPISVLNGGDANVNTNPNYSGVLGKYFKFNHRIRTLKRYEGDSIIESRFGSSIRFGAYDDNKENHSGLGEYADNGGNPMILIRNRQAPVEGSTNNSSAKSRVLEDINKDGSSIHITSGKTVSKFVPTTSIPFINITKPTKSPELSGDQIVFNSGRLVFSSKANQTLMYSKGYFGITTDEFLSLNAKGTITLSSTGDSKIILNAKKVYFGVDADGPNDEPMMLGGQTTQWLTSICNALTTLLNCNLETLATLSSHFHLATGPKAPTTPPMPVFIGLHAKQMESIAATQAQLLALRSQISTLQSSRLFVAK